MRYSIIFLLCLTACLLCIDTTSGLSLHSLTSPIVTVFIICFAFSLLPRRFKFFAVLIIGEALVSLCIVDCYCQDFLLTPVTPQILSIILLSDTRETHEFFLTFIDWHVLSHWRITIEVLISVILPLSFLPCINNRICLKWKHSYKILATSGLCLCILYEIPSTYRFMQLFFQKGDMQKMEGLIFQHYHEEVPTPIHRFAFACYSLRQSSNALNAIKQSTLSASVDSCSYTSPHIVWIIGESYNKHHSTLYGYTLPTTPRQQSLMKSGDLYVFSDVVTPWNITSNAFIDMFSLWEYGLGTSINDAPLFPILFRRAGYNVTFFSNQYILKGFRKGATNQAGHFFLADNTLSDSLFSFRNLKSSKYDMGLVRQVESVIVQERERYTLDIIHLVGQHFDYSARYPIPSAPFTMEDYSKREIDDEAKKVVMHYDNATYYNDLVIDSLLSLYAKDDVVVLYVADHGEEVYDDLPVNGRLFHEPTKALARQEFEVPMWIWCSHTYKSNHPEIVNSIKQAIDRPFMTDGIPQLLLHFAGISSKWNNTRRCLIHPNYECKKRIIAGCSDYDQLMKQ